MTPDQWLQQKFSGEFFSGQFRPLQRLVKKLDLIPADGKVITIAGTNGKGETARIISQGIKELGNSVALWTSPHLSKVSERFIFNGRAIADNELLSVFLKIDSVIQAEASCSYFEFLFLSFLSLCQKERPDFLVLEVGLGGRLDAANILDADYAVLTSIARDHQEQLGNRYELILKEKLGITRKNSPLFSALELSYLRQKVRSYCYQENIFWRDLFEEKTLKKNDHFSKRNQKLASSLLGTIFGRQIDIGHGETSFAKRAQHNILETQIDFYSSHNPDGVRKLVHLLTQDKYTSYQKVVLSFSERSYEDLRTMVKVLKSHFSGIKFYLYQFSHAKAIKSHKRERIKDEFKLEITDRQRIFEQIDFKQHQRVLCTGSQYFFSDFILAIKSYRR